ncbi:protein kinase domain-containing protein [Neorhodopirellula pilleata]|nr:protein kinase [Neorhodopirellula pilleata]
MNHQDRFDEQVCPKCGREIVAETVNETIDEPTVSPGTESSVPETFQESDSVGGHATVQDAVDVTLDLNWHEPEKTIDESVAATIESIPDHSSESDVTLDSHSPSLGSEAEGDLTMDSDADSSSVQDVRKGSGRAASGSGFNSQLGATGNASNLARMWGQIGGDSSNPMSSMGGDEQIASATLFGRLCTRSLADLDAPDSDDSDYQLLEQLGEGAMGVVFAARQKAMDRTVAIKAIKPGKHNNDDSKRKFLYEAQITGDLDHPNIVPIHELGSNSDGTLFYAMKLVSGTPWQKAIKDRSREENIDILMKVSDAIGFAHSKGIIHRDLKPDNIMLGPFGEVLVMDWGLAISVLRHQPFGLGGTPAYMSPEMAKHDVKRIGPRSDIYLLGAMLFQVVTGRAPHPGKKVTECLLSAVRNEFVPHDENDALVAIAKIAMASEVTDRYESVAAFQDAIREYRRHSESIAITQRATSLLASAQDKRDYQQFSRVLFSLDEALELWPDNQSAKKQIAVARLAYGHCAFEQGDYDLCMQTLVPGVPAEDDLIAKAKQARDLAASREQKFKRLRKVLATVILCAVVGLSALSVFLNSARLEIDKQRGQLAQTNTQLVAANDSERKAREDAERAASQEKLAKEKAIRAAEAEMKAKLLAEQAAEEARKAAIAETKAREDEAKARMVAEDALKSEKAALATAVAARDAESAALAKSLRSAMVTTLGSYQSRLNLALAQAEQHDVVRSSQLLSEIKTIENQFQTNFQQTPPLLSNWAFRRVGLLTNEDLPRVQVGERISSISLASNAPIIATSETDGRFHRFRFGNDGGVDPLEMPEVDAQVVHVAISPDGSELAFMTIDASKRSAAYVWNESTNLITSLPGIAARPMQNMSYSPDGQWLVGGVNGGLWIWKRSNGQFSTAPRRAVAKGSLRSIQFAMARGRSVANCLIAIGSEGEVAHAIVQVDLEDAQTTAFELPPFLLDGLSATATFGTQGDLLVGTETGQLHHLSAERNQYVLVAEVLPRKHATRVTRIEIGVDGHALTYGSEPVAHVWSLPDGGDVQSVDYQQTLSGLSNNLQWCDFSNDDQSVFAVDQSGMSIRWDLASQASRRNVVPSLGTKDGVDGLSAVVMGVFASEHANTFEAIDANGVLSRYTSSLSSMRRRGAIHSYAIDYIGHTPGTEISDMAFAPHNGQLVTLARRLPDNVYVTNSPMTQTELCQWDMSSGNMVARLDLDSESESRVTIAATGSIACVGGESETYLIDLQRSSVSSHPFGSIFAVTNPASESQVMLVRATGAVQLIDVIDAAKPTLSQFQLAAYSEARPVDGVWSPTGKHFYIIYENGRIARFAVNADSIEKPVLSDPIESLRILQRVRAWQSLDVRIQSLSEAEDELVSIVRSTDGEVISRLTRIRWPHRSDQPTVGQVDSMNRDLRLTSNLTDETIASIPLQSIGLALTTHSLRGLRQINSSTWVAVGVNGDIQFGNEKPHQWVHRTGRTPCIAASVDRGGDRWVVLQDNGCLWKIDRTDGKPEWRLLAGFGDGLQHIRLSTSGRDAVGLSNDDKSSNAILFDIEQETILRQWDDVANASWHPLEDRLLIASTSGRLSETSRANDYQSPVSVASVDLAGDRIQDVGYFRDTVADGNDRWYASVLRDHGTGSRVSIHRIDQDGDQPPLSFGVLDSKTRIRTIASSPTENVFVTGDESGTLIVWFASPSLDETPRELFTLPGHRGASIQCVKFSTDGSVIFTTDLERRMLGHPSDPADIVEPNIARRVPSREGT